MITQNFAALRVLVTTGIQKAHEDAPYEHLKSIEVTPEEKTLWPITSRIRSHTTVKL